MARKAHYGPYNYERTLGTRNYTFAADIDAFVKETKKRIHALALQASQDLIEEIQTPVAKGGKMHLDTGFLRTSGQVSLTGVPSGPSRGDPQQQYDWDSSSAFAILAGFELGQTIYFGWTANYAKYREAYDGFLISGIQNWQTIVNRVCTQIKAQSPANRKS